MSSQSTVPLRTVAVATAAFGATGFLAAAVVTVGVYDGGWELPAYAGGAAALVGGGVWLVTHRGDRGLSPRQGAYAGGAVGLLAHPVLWMLLWGHVAALRLVSGDAGVPSLDGGFTLLVLGFASVIFGGGVTIPVGAATGYLLARAG